MKRIFLLIIVYCLLFTPVFAQKATDYKLLAPIPLSGVDQGDTKTTTAGPYIQGLFTLIIAIAGGLAVLKIIFGGIQYMSTDAFQGKSDAKGTIQNAIWGLMLAIGAWLILFTINPKLVKFDLSIPVQEIKTPSTPPGGGGGAGIPMTPEEIAADKVVRDRLEDPNVGIRINAGPCLQGQGYGCTNLNGLPESAIQGLITLKKDCGCGVMVSGGTEPGPHKTHGVGDPIVDLANDQSLRSWMSSKGFLINNGNGAVVRLSSGRQVGFVFERVGQGRSTGDHWHVVF
ncbi:MAG TPA: pilin [Candidatus Paceibacterota bacterium]